MKFDNNNIPFEIIVEFCFGEMSEVDELEFEKLIEQDENLQTAVDDVIGFMIDNKMSKEEVLNYFEEAKDRSFHKLAHLFKEGKDVKRTLTKRFRISAIAASLLLLFGFLFFYYQNTFNEQVSLVDSLNKFHPSYIQKGGTLPFTISVQNSGSRQCEGFITYYLKSDTLQLEAVENSDYDSNVFTFPKTIPLGSYRMRAYEPRIFIPDHSDSCEIIINNLQSADFEFTSDYQLRSLEEVEQFIKEKKYLCNISIEKQLGIDKQIDRLLLEIERSLLYCIELNRNLNTEKKQRQKENSISEKRNTKKKKKHNKRNGRRNRRKDSQDTSGNFYNITPIYSTLKDSSVEYKGVIEKIKITHIDHILDSTLNGKKLTLYWPKVSNATNYWIKIEAQSGHEDSKISPENIYSSLCGLWGDTITVKLKYQSNTDTTFRFGAEKKIILKKEGD